MGSITDAKTIKEKVKEIDKLIFELNEIKTSYLELEHLDIPYVPSTQIRVETMVKLAQPKQGMRMVDLGCGDGRILIAFAKAGIEATGLEISKNRLNLSMQNLLKENLEKNVVIKEKSFFDEDLSEYDIITLYGLDSIMPKIEEKIIKEARAGTKILSNYFQFPTLKPVKEENKVYLYII